MKEFSPLVDTEDPTVFCTKADQQIIRRLSYVPPSPADGSPGPQSIDVPPPPPKSERHPCVYVHCTAGMGRAPGTALAYMTWIRGFQLDRAFEVLRDVRPCCPKLSAVRAATVDVLTGCPRVPVSLGFRNLAGAADVRVAGLDVGWGEGVPAEWSPRRGRHEVVRELPTGDFSYKLVVDGVWTTSADHPRSLDGDNWNNVVKVRGQTGPREDAMRMRILSEGGDMTREER